MESILTFEQPHTELVLSIQVLTMQLKMEKNELELWALFPFHAHTGVIIKNSQPDLSLLSHPAET